MRLDKQLSWLSLRLERRRLRCPEEYQRFSFSLPSFERASYGSHPSSRNSFSFPRGPLCFPALALRTGDPLPACLSLGPRGQSPMNTATPIPDATAVLIPSRRRLARVPIAAASPACLFLALIYSPVRFTYAALSKESRQFSDISLARHGVLSSVFKSRSKVSLHVSVGLVISLSARW